MSTTMRQGVKQKARRAVRAAQSPRKTAGAVARRLHRAMQPESVGAALGAVVAAPKQTRAAIRKRWRTWTDYRKFWRKEFRWKVSPLQRRPLWWRRGFLSRSVTLYELDKNNPDDYVTDVQRYTRTKRMVHPHLQEILDNKFSFFLLMNQLGLSSDVVPLLELYIRGGLHVFPSDERVPLKEFLEHRLEQDRKVFVKPIHGAEGRWVRAIRKTADGYVMNGEPVTMEEIRGWIERRARPMIFEAGIPQHDFQARLNPEATNTIRILTIPDMDKGREPFIARAVHRIGTELSGHIDNWTQGGLSAQI